MEGGDKALTPETALSPHQEQDLNREAAADPAPNPPNGQSTQPRVALSS